MDLFGELQPHRCRCNFVGASCILIGIPGFYYSINGQTVLGFFGINVGFVSFLSDYIFADPNKYSKIIKRNIFIFDVINILIYISLLFYNVFFFRKKRTSFILLFLLYLIKKKSLDYSAISKNKLEWRYRHTIWHINVFFLLILTHHIIGLPPP